MGITTIGLGFDFVVHNRNQGWREGKIYGDPIPGAIDGLKEILATPNQSVFVLTIRDNLEEIAQWLEGHGVPAVADQGENRQYWHNTEQVLVTRRLHVSAALIHNRGRKFRDWGDARNAIGQLY